MNGFFVSLFFSLLVSAPSFAQSRWGRVLPRDFEEGKRATVVAGGMLDIGLGTKALLQANAKKSGLMLYESAQPRILSSAQLQSVMERLKNQTSVLITYSERSGSRENMAAWRTHYEELIGIEQKASSIALEKRQFDRYRAAENEIKNLNQKIAGLEKGRLDPFPKRALISESDLSFHAGGSIRTRDLSRAVETFVAGGDGKLRSIYKIEIVSEEASRAIRAGRVFGTLLWIPGSIGVWYEVYRFADDELQIAIDLAHLDHGMHSFLAGAGAAALFIRSKMFEREVNSLIAERVRATHEIYDPKTLTSLRAIDIPADARVRIRYRPSQAELAKIEEAGLGWASRSHIVDQVRNAQTGEIEEMVREFPARNETAMREALYEFDAVGSGSVSEFAILAGKEGRAIARLRLGSQAWRFFGATMSVTALYQAYQAVFREE